MSRRIRVATPESLKSTPEPRFTAALRHCVLLRTSSKVCRLSRATAYLTQTPAAVMLLLGSAMVLRSVSPGTRGRSRTAAKRGTRHSAVSTCCWHSGQKNLLAACCGKELRCWLLTIQARHGDCGDEGIINGALRVCLIRQEQQHAEHHHLLQDVQPQHGSTALLDMHSLVRPVGVTSSGWVGHCPWPASRPGAVTALSLPYGTGMTE